MTKKPTMYTQTRLNDNPNEESGYMTRDQLNRVSLEINFEYFGTSEDADQGENPWLVETRLVRGNGNG